MIDVSRMFTGIPSLPKDHRPAVTKSGGAGFQRLSTVHSEAMRLLAYSSLMNIADKGGSEADLREKFRALADRYVQETRTESLPHRMAAHPAHQAIVAMGWRAVPLILEELEREPYHWFTALYEITGENPVRPESRGKLKSMAQDWIEWGRERQREAA